jgi:polyphosphate:AMP phosphotransferase
VAPWIVVEGADEQYRSLTVAKILLDAMRKRVDQEKKGARRVAVSAPPPPPAADRRDLINSLDMKLALTKKKFDKELEKYQGRLNLLTRNPKFKERSLICVFEGSDAAGKGGSIRRITGALDARQYAIVPIAAPTEEERAQPYLWRFWRHAPRIGRVTIFDRSWYGRVLVERVEGFAREEDWMRAYAEINDFEDQLVRSGAIVAKFWLAITAEEQLKRFKEREKTRFKRFKITEEDWRNRKKWDDYEHAVCDMIDRTSTEIAPWTLVEANDKLHARIKVLKTLCDRIESALRE